MLFVTTTNVDMDEELRNRCLLLTINESREQTKRIQNMQREARTIQGIRRSIAKEKIARLHHNVQRLIRQINIVNPYSQYLTYKDTKHSYRRDNQKYLTLIDTIALLRQYQREVMTDVFMGKVTEFIEVSIEDIRIANKIAREVFINSSSDLPPQSRVVLLEIVQFVRAGCKIAKVDIEDFRFSRRDLRSVLSIGNSQLAVHLDRLVELEYLVVHRGRRGQSFVYELAYNGEEDNVDDRLGLTDPDNFPKPKRRKGTKPKGGHEGGSGDS